MGIQARLLWSSQEGGQSPPLQMGKLRLGRLNLPNVVDLVKGRVEIPTEVGLDSRLLKAEWGRPQICRVWGRS